jgi:hypothetical protein
MTFTFYEHFSVPEKKSTDFGTQVDYKKLADALGMQNPRSASNAWSGIKKKLWAGSSATAPGSEKKATPGGRKRKNAIKEVDADNDDDEEMVNPSPTKKRAPKIEPKAEPSTPKSKSKSTTTSANGKASAKKATTAKKVNKKPVDSDDDDDMSAIPKHESDLTESDI